MRSSTGRKRVRLDEVEDLPPNDGPSSAKKLKKKKKKTKITEELTTVSNRPEPVVMMATDDRRQQMKDAFLPWVLQTYGDAAKTKTISRRKSDRIVKILKGEDRSNGADSSKFRFWVRAKGFRLGSEDNKDSSDLYVVTSTTKDEVGGEEKPVYKKVAVVEEFFDIIYREHVEFMNHGGRPTANGKHAGQKRTYRAITEIYAFLPREAVTRFLMQCADCQRRGGGGGGVGATCPSGVSPGSPTPPASPAGSSKPLTLAPHHYLPGAQTLSRLALTDIDLSLPLTSTLLKRAQLSGVSHQQLLGLDRAESSFCSPPGSAASCSPQSMTAGFKSDEEASVKSGISSTLHVQTDCDPCNMTTTGLSPNGTEDHHSPAIKDEDDEDDDDVDDKIDSQVHDPERLKAFNMFVRLFVDENLDRMVPISRQPREKVQAIIDSCLRQFPEFGERARKRIRTYLKSCRRNKRSALEMSGLNLNGSSSSLRPMPPHLTSAAAEQILAQACDNENQNAKRLRLGLDPISQPLPVSVEKTGINEVPASQNSPDSMASSTNLFRPAFGPYQRSSNVTPAPSSNNNFGATDLSMKSSRPSSGPSSSNSRNSPLPHRLNAAELLAVRQLVTGYRESAQFLLRSAEELEQLLLQQQSN